LFLFFLVIDNTAIAKTIKVFVGNEEYPPYDIRVGSSVYGTTSLSIFGTLLNSNEIHEISSGLIEKWKYDYKSKKYTLTLGSAKFHSGREINSLDLEFSIVRGFISTLENYHKIYLSDIYGSEILKPGMKFKSGMLSGLKVINSKSIEITLKSNNPVFLLHLSSPPISLVPIEELDDDYFTWKTIPIGAGPYKVDKDFQDKILILKKVKSNSRSPEYFEFHTELKKTNYDISFDRIEPEDKSGIFTKVFSKYPTSISALFFYRNKELNKNKFFRKAVNCALDRESISKGYEQFKPSFELVVPPYGGRVSAKNPYSLELAKKYISKVPKQLLKKDIVVGVFTSAVIPPSLRERLDRISSDLKKIGLNVKFEPNEVQFPTKDVMKKYSMKLWSKNVDLTDPAIIFASLSSLSPYKNEIPDTNGKFDKLYNQIVSEPSGEERLKKVQEISLFSEEQALFIPILQKYTIYRYNHETIKSLGEQYKPQYLDVTLIDMK